jgi:hypothetical protein
MPWAVGEESYPVAGIERELCQRHGGGTGVVELGMDVRCENRIHPVSGPGRRARESSDPRSHQSPTVKHDPNRLAAFGLVLAGDQASAPRGCGPADIAQIVAFAVFAQAFEVTAQAALPRQAKLQIDLPAAGQKHLLLLGGAQGGIHTNGLSQRGLGTAIRQSERRPVSHIKRPGFAVSALLRFHPIAQLARYPREDGKPVPGRLGDQGGRQIVKQPAVDDG